MSYFTNTPEIKAGCTSELRANRLGLIFSTPQWVGGGSSPTPTPQAPATSSHLCKQGAECHWESYLLPPYRPHQEGAGEGATAYGRTGANSQEAKGVTGLNWLQESSLPPENEDKQEKNTGEGQQQDSYCVAPVPGDVTRV